jgi:hypothetical protein
LRWAVTSAVASAVLVACGGGGTTGQALTGKVMDGYITGAVVCLDVNNNGVCNSGEPQAETTAGGAYTLDVPSDAQLGGTNLLVNVPVGAIDEDNPGTPIATAYSMRSVASAQAVVSPLTTILAAHLDSGETEAQALAAMGLTGVDLNEDYVAAQNTQVHNVAKLLARNFQAAGTQTAAQMKVSLIGLQTSIATAHASTAVMTEEALLALVPESSGGGSTGGTDSAIMTFDESSQPTVEVFGGAAGTIAEGPAGGTGAALQVTRNSGEGWAGAWVPFEVPSDVGTVTVSARVYSPLAGVPIVTKAEWASEQGSGEKQANEQVVVGWQTLTWTFSNLDVTKTYNRFTVLPQLGTVGSGQVFYFDDLTATAEAPSNETGSGGGGSEPVAGAALTFDEDTLPTVEVFGGAQGTVAEAPAGGTGAALQVTRSGGEGWAGAWVPFVVPSDAGTVTVSAEVYSPLAGVPIVTKAEWASEQGSGEKQANEQVVVGWQTLTWTFSNLDATKTYNRFTVLPQLGTVGSGQVFYFDDIAASAADTSGGTGTGGEETPVAAAPEIAAATPPNRDAANVISIFSDAYANVTDAAWGVTWSDGATTASDVVIAENTTKKISLGAGKAYTAVDFSGTDSVFDATEFTHFHVDYWVSGSLPGQVLSVKLSNHAGGAGETGAIGYTVEAPATGEWVSLDIPLTSFEARHANGLLARNAIAQIIVSGERADAGQPVDIYFDNMYFYK